MPTFKATLPQGVQCIVVIANRIQLPYVSFICKETSNIISMQLACKYIGEFWQHVLCFFFCFWAASSLIALAIDLPNFVEDTGHAQEGTGRIRMGRQVRR